MFDQSSSQYMKELITIARCNHLKRAFNVAKEFLIVKRSQLVARELFS